MMSSIYGVYENVVGKMGSPSKESSRKRILCVGLCNLDIVQVCPSYPREDSDQRCVESRWQRGGNASNNCTVLAQLGAPVEFLGTVSKEPHHAAFILDDFARCRVGVEHCSYHADCETPISTVIVSQETGSRTIVHSNPSLPELTYEHFRKLNLADYEWIHFEGRNTSQVLLMMEYVEHWNSQSNCERPIRISLDVEKPKDALLDLVPYADVVFVGKDFARSRQCHNMSETLKNVAKDTKDGATIICAWGELGAMARGPDGTTVQSPAYPPRKVVDTLGAGDTFCAAVIFCLSSGRGLQESIALGCRIAGAKVGQKGYANLDKIYQRICFGEGGRIEGS